MTNIFMDSSGFIALYRLDDDFHHRAINALQNLKDYSFLTTNFILDETYTFLRKFLGKEKALNFSYFLKSNANSMKIKRITLMDEKKAFALFEKYNFPDLSFTDCTSLAVMESLKLKEVFTFDRHFTQAGFHLLP